ncbi:hypothetical protein C8A01DRAFT_44897 [Parachaetomium inaequale]|uniref:CBF1-interacting co-repressor CIR N-terminal domain-containing protein n=1 Tax=Parachaetomium inaequale TaxID=2588326 RepID=A0AAN6STX5_9PEZI|nr:hypothetical protein C8A01DRAFT_44897 [Parachaetomium inaequale]
MPLHLLGKKSWNVYNPANIARVRRDEAAAQAKEEAEEQRMQEVDAARRLAILRGETPPPLEDPEPEALPLRQAHDRDAYTTLSTGRKRKRRGEDDTDYEMRIARKRASAGDRAARELAVAKPNPTATSSPSLLDSKGHLTLFEPEPEQPQSRPRHEKNEEATREAARKERELKDQYQMRLVNAAGKDGQGLTDGGPWYASGDGEAAGAPVPSKNVFGREDPKRKAREAARLGASDPLAMMKRGAKMVRELERERRKEVEERGRELRALEEEERREERRRERKRREERHSRRREQGRDSADGDGGYGRRERSRGHRDDDSEKRHRGEERERGRDRRERSDAGERSRRDHHDRTRDRSRERDRRREDKHESDGRRNHDRHPRPHKPGHDRDTDRYRQT